MDYTEKDIENMSTAEISEMISDAARLVATGDDQEAAAKLQKYNKVITQRFDQSRRGWFKKG